MKFRPDIQGLRALAITLVVLYHAFEALVPGGFLGVDIFFVISGFLITTVLLEDIRSGTFSYSRFYRKRVRRIFPALLVMLACVSVAACLVLSPFYQAEFGKTLMATATFVSNFEFEHLSGYFDEAASLKPLLHTWSLAVEEQFYLFFPVFLVFVWRLLKGRFLPAFLICGCLSLGLYLWLNDMRSPNAAFFFTPARIFELMIGALLAVDPLPPIKMGAPREALAATGMALILACALVPRLAFLDTGPLLACLGTASIIRAGGGGSSLIGGLLGMQPVTFIGAISYSLYLWHWPVLSLAKNYLLRNLTGPESLAAIGVSLILAILSRRFVEKPVLARPPNRKGAAIAASASAVFLALGAALVLGNGFPQRFPPESRRLFAYRNDFSPWRERCHSDAFHYIPYSQSCVFGTAGAKDSVIVWADSFGAELAPALGQVLPQRKIVQITYSGCPPAQDFDPPQTTGCATHNRETLTAILRDHAAHTVILFARYSSYSDFWPGFEQSVAALSAAGRRVVLIYPLPEFLVTAPDATGLLKARGARPEDYQIPLAAFRSQNAAVIPKLDSLVSGYHLVPVFPQDLFCPHRSCMTYDGRDVLYFDSYHLSLSGAKKLAQALKPLL